MVFKVSTEVIGICSTSR